MTTPLRIGMLWYEKDANLETLLAGAVAHYLKKWGIEANLAHIHPRYLPPDTLEVEIGKVWVRADPTIIQDHIFVGREER